MKHFFINFDLLKTNLNFRRIFIARTISLMGLGMLTVGLPMQVYQLSNDSIHVALVMSVTGLGMFVGLIYGGVLADRFDRRKLILLARSFCGLGFLGLAINAFWVSPSLTAIYILALWDGFFGALGVTALLSSMPNLVGREHLMQARAISMVSMRLATVVGPLVGGLLITLWGVGWNYLIAAICTLLTLMALLPLPTMQPNRVNMHSPMRELKAGFNFVLNNRMIASTMLIGSLVNLCSAMRALFPALVEEHYSGGALELGLMYSAVPLGAVLGTLISAWANKLTRPLIVMSQLCIGVFISVICFSFVNSIGMALALLVIFGYLSSTASLIQYTLVQGHTPDEYLGRINGLWTAQNTCGDSLGMLIFGLIGKIFSPISSIFLLGISSLLLGLLFQYKSKTLKNSGFNDPLLQSKISSSS